MASTVFKFSKLKNTEDINFVFTAREKGNSKSFKRQVLDDFLKNKGHVTSQVILCKEYLTKVQLKKEITDLLQKQCSESNKVSELKEKLRSLKEDKGHFLYQKAVQMFEQNLGLKIEPICPQSSSEYPTSFVFHNINKSNPKEMYSFVLVYTDENKYKVTECQPTVNGIDDLTLKLNITKNLHQFLVDLRKEFCKHS